ncbi:Tim44/TimA family putative adaptor protein [Bartonella ancashensis]|uniref:Transporter n=1 Tax=Bartonella ancashensis TaxID=1318743 RepID=A0A0M4L6N2_9HYPH|nr:Tim44/TimA family putative adaptor protein [Bartonella ancashensis]ALE03358.1 Transporter [Bartonella ancashensis]
MKFDFALGIAFVIMVVAFVQLRNVLGKRTGFEKPPFDPYSDHSKEVKVEGVEGVISLPSQVSAKKDDFGDIDAIAPEGSALNDGLRSIRQIDPNFSPQFFMNGVQIAYELIMSAFAQGDRDKLKELLSWDVFESFCAEIDQREERNEKIQFTFVGINKVEFVAARVHGKEELLTVRIVSEIISVTYNAQEERVDGDPEAIVEIKDVWTFIRNSASKDPNWKLFATEDES